MTRAADHVSQSVQAAFGPFAAGGFDLTTRQVPHSLRAAFDRPPHPEHARPRAQPRTLLRQGRPRPDLPEAALVPDLGKLRAPSHPRDYLLSVPANALAPRRVGASGRGEPVGGRRPMIAVHHAAWAMRMARPAGASATLSELVRQHLDPIPDVSSPAGLPPQAPRAADRSHQEEH